MLLLWPVGAPIWLDMLNMPKSTSGSVLLPLKSQLGVQHLTHIISYMYAVCKWPRENLFNYSCNNLHCKCKHVIMASIHMLAANMLTLVFICCC